MKIFVSSVISGMEQFRDVAARAARQLGHRVIVAEEFGALAVSPQIACLAAVRESDAVVLLLGERYGEIQASGLSATHEEYLEARGRCPVLAMVQSGVEREAKQEELVREVRDWANGLYTGSYDDGDSLLDVLVGAMHNLEMAAATAPADAEEMLGRANSLIPQEDSAYSTMGIRLTMSLASGPHQSILRPARLEDHGFIDEVQQLAMFGNTAVLDSREGTSVNVVDEMVEFLQQTCSVAVGEDGSVVFAKNL